MKSIESQYGLSACVAVCFALLMCPVALAVGGKVTVTKVDGTKLIGEVSEWNAKALVLKVGDETLSLPSKDLLRAQWQRDSAALRAQPYVELTDGTRLPHNGFEVESNVARIMTSFSQSPLSLSTEQIEFVQLSAEVGQLEELGERQAGDVLVVRKKNAESYDHLTGIVGDVSNTQIGFNWDGENIPVKRSKVAALKYFHARQLPQKEATFWLLFKDGGQIPVASLSLVDEGLEVRTPSGLQLSGSLYGLLAADYSLGKLVFLSDMKPIEQQWTPRIGLPQSAELVRQHGMPRRDQSFTGSPLSLRWPSEGRSFTEGDVRTYDKGLALRSRTICRYRVPKGMQRFISLAGMDPATAGEGHVTLKLIADGQPVWQGEIDGSSPPVEINIEFSDVREFRIEVDYGENLDFGDRLHLTEARFSK